jgi:hypothetical protein
MYRKIQPKVDLETGEITNTKELHSDEKEQLRELFLKIQTDSKNLGIPLNVKLQTIKKTQYAVIPIKENFEFVKSFHVELDKYYSKINLSIYSLAFIARFSPCIEFPFNHIKIDNDFPSGDLLAKKLNIGRNKLFEALNELEFFNIIKREKFGKQSVIYFNPFLYSRGLVLESTYELFKGSIFNPYV